MNTPEPAPTPTPASVSLVGRVISGRYRIEKMLGEGGMGAVYLAEHTHMRKRVALKLLHAEMSQDAEVLARFRREAESAAHVEHPTVAAATDFGQTDDGAFFLVLEYVEGTSLRDVLAAGALSSARALHVARQIALALERAHGAGIVHRDLKPENVMLVLKGQDPDFVKVLDFGIAKVEPHLQRDPTQPLTRLGTILGTPEYMAPEQALGETVGPLADLYAVGVILYEMLTGYHPFDASDRVAILSMHLVAPVPTMRERNPAAEIPPLVEALTRRLLEKDMKLRFESARALVDAIDVAAAQSGIELAHAMSTRGVGRESAPGIVHTPQAEPAPSSRTWQENDALAKTDYGLPASTAELATRARTEHGESPAWPAFLAPLQKLPRNALIGIAAAVPLFFGALIVVLVLARRPATTGPHRGSAGVTETEPAKRASPEKLRAATTEGIPALEKLALAFPDDAAVQKQLALSLLEAGRTADAMRVMRTLSALDKNAIDDALVQPVVAAAQRPDTTEDAFALLEGPLGPRGVDALLEMSTTKTISAAIRNRATKSLARAEVRAAASPATGVFLEFKAATGCTAKRDLLERVKDDGDARLAPALKSMKSPRGCGFMGIRDCWPCLRKDDALDDALKAVEARPAR